MGGAVGNVCKSLLKKALIEEFEAADLNTVWRHDEERGPITLRATPLAYTVLGIADDMSDEPPTETPTAPVQRRKGTKQEALIVMLRAAMSGALKKKLGLTIASEKVDGRGRVYRIEDAA